MYRVTLSDAANDLFVWVRENNDDFMKCAVKSKKKTLWLIDGHSPPNEKSP